MGLHYLEDAAGFECDTTRREKEVQKTAHKSVDLTYLMLELHPFLSVVVPMK